MTEPNQEMSRSVLAILDANEPRKDRAAKLSDLIRMLGPYRWAGLYDVDIEKGLVSNIAWTGPNAPEYPVFSMAKGLTSRAISTKATVNVGNVAEDQDYLTALVPLDPRSSFRSCSTVTSSAR